MQKSRVHFYLIVLYACSAIWKSSTCSCNAFNHFLGSEIKQIVIFLLTFHRDPSILAECGLDDETKEVLLNNIKRKLTSQAVKIRADIEVACYGYEGIDAVKAALRAGLACSTEELPIKINLIAPPLYGN